MEAQAPMPPPVDPEGLGVAEDMDPYMQVVLALQVKVIMVVQVVI